MKKILYTLSASLLAFQLSAQLANGSDAPLVEVTDINGKTYKIADYIADGKTVYIDFFAAHCPYCWAYKNTGAMNGLYVEHGPSGSVSNDVVIIAIELDPNNGLNELSGASGYTQGNWIAALNYPIINPEGTKRSEIISAFQANYYPLIYGICPNGKIYNVGTISTQGLNNFRTTKCADLTASLTDLHPTNQLWSLDGTQIQFDATVEAAEIYTLLGTKVYVKEAGNQFPEFNTGEIYILQMKVGENLITDKFMISH